MRKPAVGLLPLYIKLYDDAWPELRKRVEPFYDTIALELESRGLDVVRVPICRIREEFERAVRTITDSAAIAIVTLHLAYSPSLESAKVLALTDLPVIVLDTTPTYEYSPATDPDELNYNHGIHGVQDMCNLLLRNGKPFMLEAGHWRQSDVLDRVASCCMAAVMAHAMRNARVGIIGGPFDGMGDFIVPDDVLRSGIGISKVAFDPSGRYDIQTKAIESEIALDRSRYIVGTLDRDVHVRATMAGLAVRQWIAEEKLTAFTVNFLSVNRESGVACMPFLEASKAMACGIGYAGEGDVLTAALVGSLLQAYPETSFCEMFCPDWKNDTILLSHMGEMNIALTAEQPVLVEKEFPFTDAGNTVVAYGRFREGPVTLVNLAPGRGDSFSLIMVSGNMLAVTGEDRMENSIHGWFKPDMPVSDLLREYSLAGGTHHLALIYDAEECDLLRFASMMNWKTVRI